MKKKVLSAALLSAAPTSLAAEPAAQAIPLSEAVIDLSKVRNYEFRDVAGREALCLDGVGLLREFELASGAIAVDVAVSGQRQFANLIFKARDADNFEEAYLRLHKSRQPDAVQYSPVLNGETNWQLYPQHQMAADFGDGEWVTFRVDFAGDRALVSVEGDDKATLAVEELALREPGRRVGLGSLMGACFSNLRTMAEPNLPAPPLPALSAQFPGLIKSWALSPAAQFSSFDERAPEPDASWSTEATEPDGLLMISRYRRKLRPAAFEQNSIDVVHAGVTLRSDQDRKVELEFDASDRARVYLDGEPLYEMDNSFRAKGPLFRGDFGMGGRKLVIPLKRGDNRLVIAVAERANGWGIAARLANPDGIEVLPLAK